MIKKKIAPGVWKITLGEPESLTPVSLLQPVSSMAALVALGDPEMPECGVRIGGMAGKRGFKVVIPMQTTEDIYGFGLQLYSINQVGKKKTIRVNSDPVADTGDSHAPVPFYASTAGYGIYVDTARYAAFHVGSNTLRGESRHKAVARKEHEEFSENALYAVKQAAEERQVIVDIPAADGVDIYLFAGADLKQVVQRYNLFSGGGALPPMWGLGNWYRTYGGSVEADVYRLTDELRQRRMPVDVFGLEPGWHSHSYSCSFQWDSVRFPNPDKMLRDMGEAGYRVNLWEHVFVHPTAELYDSLMDKSGDYEVWGGLVPDMAMPEVRALFAAHHGERLIDKGVSGFKLDECDNSDFNPSSWSFPNCAAFPSGLDGEQMHNLIGLLYQRAVMDAFRQRNARTLSQVRSSGALAAPMPFVLYSDLYNHRAFIRGVATSGFSGLLWAPEVRSCSSGEDLIRRMQTIVFSPHALLNCWRIPNLPWKQVELEKNLAGEFMENWEETEAVCRALLETRMQLLPYLYSAFARYQQQGIPPFRALVMDFPEDQETRQVDDQYMMGPDLMVAPLVQEDQGQRRVYFPEGVWVHFQTGERVNGKQWLNVCCPLEAYPVYVREGTLLPVAAPVQCVRPDTVLEVTLRKYGNTACSCEMYEDDGVSLDYQQGIFNRLCCSVNAQGMLTVERYGNFSGVRYVVNPHIQIVN